MLSGEVQQRAIVVDMLSLLLCFDSRRSQPLEAPAWRSKVAAGLTWSTDWLANDAAKRTCVVHVLGMPQNGTTDFTDAASRWLTWGILNELDDLASRFVHDHFKRPTAVL
jgi:hypothetical protein